MIRVFKQKYPFFPLISSSITFVLMYRYLFIAFFFVLACNQSQVVVVEKPDDLIPEEKMVQVLADVHMLEAVLTVKNPQTPHPRGPITMEFPKDTSIASLAENAGSNSTLALYDIFKKNDVTRKQYQASMQYYGSQPEKLDAIYDEVITELTTRQLKDK
ncbi:hypothetical protein BH09BAC5_BH09BAC5_19300 [soil metagenome]